jgi:iron complex outermembrane receptor protein
MFGLASALATGTSQAQTAKQEPDGAIQEIVVTAQRRAENVQKTGASVSVRSGEDLLKVGKFSLSSIIEDVPGITGGAAFATGGTAGGGTDNPAAGLVIRGIPSNTGAGGSTTSTSSAAAIYVDGVYNGLGGNYDLERVEILRGPQGTLYGRSATAGLVAIHTRNPDLQDFGGVTSVELGNYGLQHYSGALNLPLVKDVLSVRVAGNYYGRDGFFDADGGAISSTEGRVKVLYKPSETFSLLLGAAFNDSTDHSGGRQIAVSPDPREVAFVDVNQIASVRVKTRQYWAEANLDLGFGTLTYMPTYRSFKNNGTLLVNGVLGVLTQPISTDKNEFITQELRLASNPGSALAWQTGLFYYDNVLSNKSAAILPFGLIYEDEVLRKKTKAYGLFAEATYPVMDTVRVTAGLRYDDTKVGVNELYTPGPILGGGAPFELKGDAGKRHFTNVTYKLRLEHDLTPQNLLYASVSTGFSPGDVTVAPKFTPTGIVLEALSIEAEKLTSYEIGSKNRFLDNKLQVNLAAFFSKYGAYQSAGINTNPNGQPSVFTTLSSPLESYGLEFELTARPTPADVVKLNAGWTHARFVNKLADFAFWVANDEVSSTNTPGSQAPIPFTAALSYDHSFAFLGDGTLTLHGDVRYLSGHSGFYSTLDQAAAPNVADNVHVKSATLGNLSATWAPADFVSLTAYVRNVGNHRYITKTLFSRDFGVYQPYVNDPRTYGAVLTVNF